MGRTVYNLLFLIIFMSFCAVLWAESDEESEREDQKSYQLVDGISLYSEKKELWSQQPTVYVKAVFPALEADGDNDAVDEFNTFIDAFIKAERTDFQADIKQNAAMQATLPKKLQKNQLYIDYSSALVRSKKQKILSVRFTVQRYMGGMAHPTNTYHSINYDLVNGQALELSSLFKPDSQYLEVLSGIVSDVLAKRLKDHFDSKSISPTSEHFAKWNLKSDGLLFTFDEGEVAPRVYGAQTVLVRYQSIIGLLAEDSIVSQCANKKSRCLASSVLMGGFSDEGSITSAAYQSQAAASVA